MEQLADIRIINDANTLTAATLPIAYETTCVISNLSHTGAQLQCEPRLINALFPEAGDKRCPQPCFQINFEVDLQAGPELVSCQCQVIYIRRVARENYVIGCEFRDFTEGSTTTLKTYLREKSATQKVNARPTE